MLEELTKRFKQTVDGKEAFGFSVKFDLGDTGVIFVAGGSAPIEISNDNGDAARRSASNRARFKAQLRDFSRNSDVIARSAATKQPLDELARPFGGCRVGLRPPRNDVALFDIEASTPSISL